MYLARIRITLRPSILDPQGKATQHALTSLGLDAITSVRIGTYVEMRIETSDATEAMRLAQQACEKLLANPVMEDYDVRVDALEETTA